MPASRAISTTYIPSTIKTYTLLSKKLLPKPFLSGTRLCIASSTAESRLELSWTKTARGTMYPESPSEGEAKGDLLSMRDMMHGETHDQFCNLSLGLSALPRKGAGICGGKAMLNGRLKANRQMKTRRASLACVLEDWSTFKKALASYRSSSNWPTYTSRQRSRTMRAARGMLKDRLMKPCTALSAHF